MIPYIADLQKGSKRCLLNHQTSASINNLTISSQMLATEAGLSWELWHQDRAHLPAMLVG